MDKRIVIIGAGPTGLGCAFRLLECGHKNFHVFEANDYAGGLSSSFLDKNGFTWDVGGHVLFSHYDYFDKLLDNLLKKRFLHHTRASWIRIFDRFVPYPFQNNLRYLPPDAMSECLSGLKSATFQKDKNSSNFREWIPEIFGNGIARYFMFPYNEKTWAYPLEKMSKTWIAERVSVVDFERVRKNVEEKKDDVSWGPNSTFKFPENGGTGAIFRAFVPTLKGHVAFNRKCIRINTKTSTVHFKDGSSEPYDYLVTTAPLTEIAKMLEPQRNDLAVAAENLVFASGVMIGLGFSRPCPSDKCWVYFPENKAPFYRMTYFSNYSPNNVPQGNYFSLMVEVSYSNHKKIDKSNIVNEAIEGLVQTGIIEPEWKADIVSTYVIDVPYSYPVPSLGRNLALSRIVPELAQMNIFPRGRFGLWIYEIGNMDHSVMQGAELADFLLDEKPQSTIAPYKFILGEEK